MSVPSALQWDGQPTPAHVVHLETAHRLYHFLPTAIARVRGEDGTVPLLRQAVIMPLAVGGGMAVYKATVTLGDASRTHLVCKIPHQRRILYTHETAHHAPGDVTRALLDRLVVLADRLAQHAPGLFPRSGGAWHWHAPDGTDQHLLVEEFIPGLSIERLKHRYEQQWLAQELSEAGYQQRRVAIERLAIATFVRLWDGLGRRLFTSDPSPWNVLVHDPEAEPSPQAAATVIDLHGLEEDAGLSYVVQRLTAVYGARQEVLEEVLLPGVLDALGEAAGRALLQETLPALEAEAERARRNLGVDLHQPLLRLIRQLA